MKQKVTWLCILAVISASIGLACAATAPGGTFPRVKTFEASVFGDVTPDAWYFEDVATVYELGLMDGEREGVFDPDGVVTVAQAITMAARVNSIYWDKTIPEGTGTGWYAAYLEYAMRTGLVQDGQFDTYERPVKRQEAAVLFARALPAEGYPEINTVESIPDVPSDAPYAQEVLMLYRGGVIMGNDAFGTFSPNSDIKRSEAAAILGRIAVAQNRLRKTLAPTPAGSSEGGDAVYLIDDLNMASYRGLASGWDYDNRAALGNSTGTRSSSVNDTSAESGIRLKRNIKPQSSGTVVFETIANLTDVRDGAYLLFSDEQYVPVLRLYTQDGTLYAQGAEQVELFRGLTGMPVQKRIKVTMDLDSKTGTVMLDGATAGSAALGEGAALSRVVIGTTDEGKASFQPLHTQMYTQYAVNDKFLAVAEGPMPDDWTADKSVRVGKILSNSGYDVYSAKITPDASKPVLAQKQFSPVSGKVVFEVAVLLPEYGNKASVSLRCGETAVAGILSQDTAFTTADGTELRKFTNNIWQILRIEADTEMGCATYKIDGKTVAENVPFHTPAQKFDNIVISTDASDSGVLWFDDVKVFRLIDHEDGVPQPVPAPSDGYQVGMHVCSLWRNGHSGEGWEAASSFDDLYPYLGFYDEGLPEVADWEIKWMVEHGIDFQHLCWYSPYGDLTAPIKEPRNSAALHDGYFNAKYSDAMKFCFMWENSNVDVHSLEQFQQMLVPYWVEYYFTDPRYLTLDNKLVMTVWNLDNYIQAFGGEDGAKEATEYLDSVAKDLGFDGFLLFFADQHQMTRDFFDKAARVGADAVYGYHWNRTGSDPDHQIYRMSTQQAFDAIHIVPTISVGFNAIGRHWERSDMISLEGHRKVLEYVRDEFLPAYGKRATGWERNTLFLSTWNEFTEGTYVMPSNLNGFGYLDNVRDVLTDAGAHTDEKPTPAQVSRICNLYSPGRTPIRPLGYEVEPKEIPTQIVKSWDFSKAEDAAQWKAQFGIEHYENTGGVLAGSSEKSDYAVRLSAPVSIPISKENFVHLRLKTSGKGMNFEIYFITDADSSWNDSKSVRASITEAGQYVDYYVDMAACSLWNGTLTDLRIDPMTGPGTFEIALVEILSPEDDTDSVRVLANLTPMEFTFRPVKAADGDVLVTANPSLGFFSLLQSYYEFNRFDGSLYVVSKTGTELRMTVGSDRVLVDGTEQTLPEALSLRDGLPVVPIKRFTEWLGYSCTIEGNTASVVTVSDTVLSVLQSRKENEWEFSLDGDSEGWTTQNAIVEVKDGAIGGTAAANSNGFYDPAILSPALSIDASQYKKVAVGIQLEKADADAGEIQLFFKGPGQEYAAERNAVMPHRAPTTNGEVVEIIFDLTDNAQWSGEITGIRIDPFNGQGEFYIDYVRVVGD